MKIRRFSVAFGVLAAALSLGAPGWAQSENGEPQEQEQAERDPLAELPVELAEPLRELDRAMAEVQTLRAGFTRERTTALLRRPLSSTGTVRMAGGWVRWDTDEPRVSQTLITEEEIRILFPEDRRMEVYPMDERFAEFGVGPTPRMAELARRFEIERVDPAVALGEEQAEAEDGDESRLAIALTPRDEQLAEHVDRVSLVIDRSAQLIEALRVDQPDGTSTRYRFTELERNPELTREALALDPPAGVEIVYPYSDGNGEGDGEAGGADASPGADAEAAGDAGR